MLEDMEVNHFNNVDYYIMYIDFLKKRPSQTYQTKCYSGLGTQ